MHKDGHWIRYFMFIGKTGCIIKKNLKKYQYIIFNIDNLLFCAGKSKGGYFLKKITFTNQLNRIIVIMFIPGCNQEPFREAQDGYTPQIMLALHLIDIISGAQSKLTFSSRQ
jgi:hypothetical protein